MQGHLHHHRILCATYKLPDRHLKFECSVLHSNVDFYFKFDEYSKFVFFGTALRQTHHQLEIGFSRSAFLETTDQTSQSDYRQIVISSRSIGAPASVYYSAVVTVCIYCPCLLYQESLQGSNSDMVIAFIF